MSTALGYPSSAKLPEAFATHAVATSGASPSRIAGSTIESVQANNNFDRLISARRLPAMARNRPPSPPARLSSTLSVRSCRTTRPRPAPSAMRTAISWVRRAARASSRLATLAQAINNSSPTAPSRVSSAARTGAATTLQQD